MMFLWDRGTKFIENCIYSLIHATWFFFLCVILGFPDVDADSNAENIIVEQNISPPFTSTSVPNIEQRNKKIFYRNVTADEYSEVVLTCTGDGVSQLSIYCIRGRAWS